MCTSGRFANLGVDDEGVLDRLREDAIDAIRSTTPSAEPTKRLVERLSGAATFAGDAATTALVTAATNGLLGEVVRLVGSAVH